MSPFRRAWLLGSAAIAIAGAFVHLAVPFLGPEWYTVLGAPPQLGLMAQAGSLRPAATCVVIACVLLLFAAYALSGLGFIRRLPLLRLGLAVIGGGLVFRAVSFFGLAMWKPSVLSTVCGRCESVNGFLAITSAICLFAGSGYILAALAPSSSEAAPQTDQHAGSDQVERTPTTPLCAAHTAGPLSQEASEQPHRAWPET